MTGLLVKQDWDAIDEEKSSAGVTQETSPLFSCQVKRMKQVANTAGGDEAIIGDDKAGASGGAIWFKNTDDTSNQSMGHRLLYLLENTKQVFCKIGLVFDVL